MPRSYKEQTVEGLFDTDCRFLDFKTFYRMLHPIRVIAHEAQANEKENEIRSIPEKDHDKFFPAIMDNIKRRGENSYCRYETKGD